jgi:SulP family sulfate permease
MTAVVVDELSSSGSDKNRECVGQGVANIAAGFFGGMAGCAMIGQTVVNRNAGGRERLSAFAAGVFLLVLIILGGAWVKLIPMAALVAVMIMVSISTFNWRSLAGVHRQPRSSTVTMITTVLAVVLTRNLAIGVLAGVLMNAVLTLGSRLCLIRRER